ncbi:TetR/AcrR family transcriptional regulator [Pseudonocardia hispaniensis]|uniref:TetR/AcrR family transcriptional regulator n=1 Tax=Pseudonocardia hispaniensis TaxID=904933 RepID=A0ABW1IZ65_9PSEU
MPRAGERSGEPVEPPVIGRQAVRERADAVRNRARVLEAAERLFAERGVAAVSMDDVVAAAGVGKGTLYRRFGDKSGLAGALLDERERALRQRILNGPPPLGPGAPAHERLAAFTREYLDFVIAHLDLVAMSETASTGARLRSGAHRFWRQHAVDLLTAGDARDAAVRADVLLSALSAEQIGHWIREEHRAPDALRDALGALAVDLSMR